MYTLAAHLSNLYVEQTARQVSGLVYSGVWARRAISDYRCLNLGKRKQPVAVAPRKCVIRKLVPTTSVDVEQKRTS